MTPGHLSSAEQTAEVVLARARAVMLEPEPTEMMSPAIHLLPPVPPHARGTAPMSKLTAVANVLTILTCLVVLFWLATSAVRAINFLPHGSLAALQTQSSTSAEAAEITLTNLTAKPVYACLQGRVTNKAGNSTESAVVCSGEMPGHSTVHLKAPYKVGAVLDLCNKPGAFGGKTLEWSECSFTTTDRTNLAP